MHGGGGLTLTRHGGGLALTRRALGLICASCNEVHNPAIHSLGPAITYATALCLQDLERIAPPFAHRPSYFGEQGHTDCTICQSPYETGEVVRKLPCNHMYHKECLDRWLHDHYTCPHCRGDVREMQPHVCVQHYPDPPGHGTVPRPSAGGCTLTSPHALRLIRMGVHGAAWSRGGGRAGSLYATPPSPPPPLPPPPGF